MLCREKIEKEGFEHFATGIKQKPKKKNCYVKPNRLPFARSKFGEEYARKHMKVTFIHSLVLIMCFPPFSCA